jgi:hypothetical protein
MAASPVSTIGDALSTTGSDLLQVGAIGLGIGAGVLVLRKGWKVVRGFF